MMVGAIGLTEGHANLDGKAVAGVFKGGKSGEGAKLATDFEKGMPAAAKHLIPKLKEIRIEECRRTKK